MTSKDGSLKNSSIVSQIEAGYEDDDNMDDEFNLDGIISSTIGEAIRNPNAAKQLEEYYTNLRKTNKKTKP